MPPLGFEPTISAGERPQTYALDRAATGTGMVMLIRHENVLGWCHTLVTGLEDVDCGSEVMLLACSRRNFTKMCHVCPSVCRVLPVFSNNVTV